MSQRRFYDANHANSYLNGSVVRRTGRPIMIDSVGVSEGKHSHQVLYRYVSEPSSPVMLSYLATDGAIDFTPIPLGMCMYKSKSRKRIKTLYLTRRPARMWKVGLTPRSLGVWAVVPDPSYTFPPLDRILWSQYFEDMVQNTYPDYDEAFHLQSLDTTNEIAISRRFVIANKKLYYKALQEVVGSVKKNGVILNDEYQYLHAVLKEDAKDAYK